MSLKAKGLWSLGLSVALLGGLSAQSPAPAGSTQQPPPLRQPENPTFRVQIDLVTNDIIVRDQKGQFVPDLKRDEFEVYEDGVKQDISSMTVVTGGRVTNLLAPPPPPPPEGIILPPTRQVNDTSGRIFVFFVDDLHMEFGETARVRDLFKRIEKNLLHDGDMWGMVSTGTSSISIDMTYDKNRFESAIKKITGNGLTATDIIQGSSGGNGPQEIRYRANVAFKTVAELLDGLDKVHNRRKAVVYVSSGYDFNPYQDARLGLMDPSSGFQQNQMAQMANTSSDGSGGSSPSEYDRLQRKQPEEFADADLAQQLGELTRSANRANTTFYTIDPRGLVGGSDIGENLDPMAFQEFTRKTQDSLRVLAEETGGVAVVNQNDFDKALKRIDAETSDYYVLGYYSSNPDPLKRRRQLEVRTTRKGLSIWSRKEYVLKPPPSSAPSSSKKPVTIGGRP
jgi:VWFA-related protein